MFKKTDVAVDIVSILAETYQGTKLIIDDNAQLGPGGDATYPTYLISFLTKEGKDESD